VQSPLFCASGVSGGELRKRITQIMVWRPPVHLTLARKLALTVAGVAILTVPVAIGMLRAQTLPPPPQFKFEVASIKPANNGGDFTNRLGPGPQGGLRAENVTPMQLVGFAYDVKPFQITGGPSWAHSERFNVTATPDKPEPPPSFSGPREKVEEFIGRIRQRTQALLLERFGLVLRAETKEMQVYSLVVRKGGHKLKPSEGGKESNMSTSDRLMTGRAVNIGMIASSLSRNVLRMPVLDDTGVTGLFDVRLEWSTDSDSVEAAGGAAGPSIFTAVQEQLGLKLETKKAPQAVFVIEKVDRPSEN
jgi:uncharacterized protein (TIGR03435 family)